MSASKSKRPSSGRRGGPAGGAAASARARLLAEQAQALRRRRQLMVVVIPLAFVLVVVGVFVVVRLTRAQNVAAPPSGSASAEVITAVTKVPASTLDQIGAGTATQAPRRIQGTALTEGGKPRILYVGAEYCPFCAAERWSMVVALSRFGTFSGLGQTASSARDVHPSTPTLSFHGSTFTSSTIAFTGVETRSNEIVGGQYAELDQLSAADQQVFDTFNAPPYVPQDSAGAIPFVDIGGQFLINGASYDVSVLSGKTHQQIATALADPNSDVAKAVDGAANLITAAICETTNKQPSAVCGAAGVTAAAQKLT